MYISQLILKIGESIAYLAPWDWALGNKEK